MTPAQVTALLQAVIPAEAPPQTLDRATAFYVEIARPADGDIAVIDPLPLENIALLLAYQQLAMEGLGMEYQRIKSLLEGRQTVEAAIATEPNDGKIIRPRFVVPPIDPHK